MRPEKLGGKYLNDPLVGTAPIFKVSPEGVSQLIGTGFWVTTHGHLITAWHVIEDNIGMDGVDEGPIYAVQTLLDRKLIFRSLRKTHKHGTSDLALCSTMAPKCDVPPTIPHMLTLDEPEIGARLHTYAFLSPEQDFSGEKDQGVTSFEFRGMGFIPDLDIRYELSYMARVSLGTVTDWFRDRRDDVMLPFPCIQSDMPVYGANSGGPVFDQKGRVCGVNCTSYQGADISFHVPLRGALELFARDIELIPEDPVPRSRSVLELGLAGRVAFDPPLSRVFFSLPVRILLWPYHRILDWRSALRWRFRELLLKVAGVVERARGKY